MKVKDSRTSQVNEDIEKRIEAKKRELEEKLKEERALREQVNALSSELWELQIERDGGLKDEDIPF